MSRLLFTLTWLFVAISTPAIAMAESHNDYQNINYDAFLTSNSAWNSQAWIDNMISEKSIIKNSKPLQGSFQELSENESKWSNPSKSSDVEEMNFESKQEGGHWDAWLTNLNHHDDEGNFHDQMVNEHKWEHAIGHGEHEMDDEHMAQPVPEPGTFLMMALGVLSFSLLRRRQY